MLFDDSWNGRLSNVFARTLSPTVTGSQTYLTFGARLFHTPCPDHQCSYALVCVCVCVWRVSLISVRMASSAHAQTHTTHHTLVMELHHSQEDVGLEQVAPPLSVFIHTSLSSAELAMLTQLLIRQGRMKEFAN